MMLLKSFQAHEQHVHTYTKRVWLIDDLFGISRAYFMTVYSWYFNTKDVAEGFFLLLTQIALIYKVEKFYSNRHRIKACEKLLRSTLFCPKDNEEDAWVHRHNFH